MERIVVGVDPSPAGRQALDWAVRECLARGAGLTAVRAWQTPVFGFYYAIEPEISDGPPLAQTEAQRLADEELKPALERVPGGEGLDARATSVMGPPAQVLVDAARDASMVVVGTRGLGALSRAVLGSVSSSVLHHAGCPVAVVPEVADAEVEPPRVLVGIDHSPASRAALRYGVEHARRHAAVLVPVFVHEPVVAGGGPDLRDLEGSEQASLLATAAAAGAADLVVEPEVCTGHAGEVLNRLARPQDVLVTGSRGRGGFTGLLLGSTSTSLAQHATCPVIVVRS